MGGSRQVSHVRFNQGHDPEKSTFPAIKLLEKFVTWMENGAKMVYWVVPPLRISNFSIFLCVFVFIDFIYIHIDIILFQTLFGSESSLSESEGLQLNSAKIRLMGCPRCNPVWRTASDPDIQWTGMRMAVPCPFPFSKGEIGSEENHGELPKGELPTIPGTFGNEEKILQKAVNCWRDQQKT